ncbi:unnamed protein product [Cuscuta epithymum]|uniref:Uncharacterized protein n=1 Tax=Cuscuta epithymum TaxID=186058 RepID=A0AAV0GL25_9ASTE|nr:unnamed protein product [Cuscuta epithymum]
MSPPRRLPTGSQHCQEQCHFGVGPKCSGNVQDAFCGANGGGSVEHRQHEADAKNIATILKHSEAKAFFVDYEYVEKAKKALEIMMGKNIPMPLLVDIDDDVAPTGIRLGNLEYEELIL